VSNTFIAKLYLPAQAATETEATILKWHVREGEAFQKGRVLAEVESAKSTFEFEAPCAGTVKKLLYHEGATLPFESPVMEAETTDAAMKTAPATAAAALSASAGQVMAVPRVAEARPLVPGGVSLLGIGGYLPARVVTNAELLCDFPEMTDEYLFGVTGIRERRWAAPGELPSDMACRASEQAIAKSGLAREAIGAIVLCTTTPDTAMPATACVVQHKLGLRGVPSFDINAACSGWLYAITVAKGLVLAGVADNILVVAVDAQSQLLDKKDRDTYFLFGDGAGATVVSRSHRGHLIMSEILVADAQGMQMARREYPGYRVVDPSLVDPWVRLDGRALFKFATTSFASIIRDVVAKSSWALESVRWVVPHQANGRILKAAAARSGVAFERFYLNIHHVGNTSSASIPLALLEVEKGLQQGDRLVFCSVGAGITAAAVSIEW
jgi:3-oxoacyl-[acyl-carrier-protein] synthase III